MTHRAIFVFFTCLCLLALADADWGFKPVWPYPLLHNDPIIVEAVGEDVYFTALRQLTDIRWKKDRPVLLPDNSGVLFASDMHNPGEGDAHLYIVDLDGENLRRVTTEGTLNVSPSFSQDGTHLVFLSNRNSNDPYQLDLVVVQWKPKE